MWATANLIREVQLMARYVVTKTFQGAMSFDISISKMTPIVIGWMRQCAYQLCCNGCKLRTELVV